MPAAPHPAAPRLAETLGLIIGLLGRAAAPLFRKGPAAEALLSLLFRRLAALLARFTSLAARAAAGTLQPPKPRDPPTPRVPGAPRAPVERLPSEFGWVIGNIPGSAAAASQLRALLADPAMQALLEAAPQAVRTLRPLCRMLGLEELSKRPPRNWPSRPVRRLIPPDPPPPPAATLATLPYRTVADRFGLGPRRFGFDWS